MKITIEKIERASKNISKFDVASRLPAWAFADQVCPVCLWGISEDVEDIYSEQVVVAESEGERYVFHPSCFKNTKVDRWI